jgi:UDP-N-acetylmuramate dehydrogenase
VNPVLTSEAFRKVEQVWLKAGGKGQIPSFSSGESTKISAAWLVENAGYPKGFRKGAVGVSSNHALALINAGGTTQDLLNLADEIRSSVHKRFGIILENEPVVVS